MKIGTDGCAESRLVPIARQGDGHEGTPIRLFSSSSSSSICVHLWFPLFSSPPFLLSVSSVVSSFLFSPIRAICVICGRALCLATSFSVPSPIRAIRVIRGPSSSLPSSICVHLCSSVVPSLFFSALSPIRIIRSFVFPLLPNPRNLRNLRTRSLSCHFLLRPFSHPCHPCNPWSILFSSLFHLCSSVFICGSIPFLPPPSASVVGFSSADERVFDSPGALWHALGPRRGGGGARWQA